MPERTVAGLVALALGVGMLIGAMVVRQPRSIDAALVCSDGATVVVDRAVLRSEP